MADGYHHLTARSLYSRLLCNAAEVTLMPDSCLVALKQQHDLAALLDALAKVGTPTIPWIGDRRISFRGATRS